ncbi:hypothetical protein NEOLEDRAFT_1149070 [Neolentinus lepideus HHB14362 ss-1]|uniref:Uncharacterized protein n=1 Tax=Neolentinus lepideus HHB14362 ss-1 TaxID=1314782 RepID=A0A165RGG2_9AGAM|nr:hypothetical protein NEOLEDRAFT_1149070 [Neolentinus lepideus HHB14362 ss-1]
MELPRAKRIEPADCGRRIHGRPKRVSHRMKVAGVMRYTVLGSAIEKWSDKSMLCNCPRHTAAQHSGLGPKTRSPKTLDGTPHLVIPSTILNFLPLRLLAYMVITKSHLDLRHDHIKRFEANNACNNMQQSTQEQYPQAQQTTRLHDNQENVCSKIENRRQTQQGIQAPQRQDNTQDNQPPPRNHPDDVHARCSQRAIVSRGPDAGDGTESKEQTAKKTNVTTTTSKEG